jgi:hypothetical protein
MMLVAYIVTIAAGIIFLLLVGGWMTVRAMGFGPHNRFLNWWLHLFLTET